MKTHKWLLPLTVIFIGFVLCSFFSDRKERNRQFLKDYVLYRCLVHGFKEQKIDSLDYSGIVYFDIACYSDEAFWETDSLAQVVSQDILQLKYKDGDRHYNDTVRSGIIIISIDYYNSKELDTFIKNLDIHMCEFL